MADVQWCNNIFCHKKYPEGHKSQQWWDDWGTCSRGCAECYYGEDVVSDEA